MRGHDSDPPRIMVISGSARTDGETATAIRHLRQHMGDSLDVVDLSAVPIRPFDYARTDDRDAFRAIIGKMVASEHIVFATPVYWYAMSGLMKTFFDRLTDLLLDGEAKKMGRALGGRNVWVLATGTEPTLPPGFHEPFARTAAYFGMVWREAFYQCCGNGRALTAGDSSAASELADRLLAAMDNR